MKRSGHTESQIQQWFIKWCWINQRKYPKLRLGFAVPNQGQRDVRNASRMKAEGLRAGVPDWMLPVSQGGNHFYSGLAIEFKRPGGKLTKAQEEYHALLKQEGWCVAICYDWKLAAEIVEDYLC